MRTAIVTGATAGALLLTLGSSAWFPLATGAHRMAPGGGIGTATALAALGTLVAGALAVASSKRPAVPLWPAVVVAVLPAGLGASHAASSLAQAQASDAFRLLGATDAMGSLAEAHLPAAQAVSLSAITLGLIALLLGARSRETGPTTLAAGLTGAAAATALAAGVGGGLFLAASSRAAIGDDGGAFADAHAEAWAFARPVLLVGAIALGTGAVVGARRRWRGHPRSRWGELAAGVGALAVVAPWGRSITSPLIAAFLVAAAPPAALVGQVLPVIDAAPSSRPCPIDEASLLAVGENVALGGRSLGSTASLADPAACRAVWAAIATSTVRDLTLVAPATMPVAELACLLTPPQLEEVLRTPLRLLARRGPTPATPHEPPFDRIGAPLACIDLPRSSWAMDLASWPVLITGPSGPRTRPAVAPRAPAMPVFSSHPPGTPLATLLADLELGDDSVRVAAEPSTTYAALVELLGALHAANAPAALTLPPDAAGDREALRSAHGVKARSMAGDRDRPGSAGRHTALGAAEAVECFLTSAIASKRWEPTSVALAVEIGAAGIDRVEPLRFSESDPREPLAACVVEHLASRKMRGGLPEGRWSLLIEVSTTASQEEYFRNVERMMQERRREDP